MSQLTTPHKSGHHHSLRPKHHHQRPIPNPSRLHPQLTTHSIKTFITPPTTSSFPNPHRVPAQSPIPPQPNPLPCWMTTPPPQLNTSSPMSISTKAPQFSLHTNQVIKSPIPHTNPPGAKWVIKTPHMVVTSPAWPGALLFHPHPKLALVQPHPNPPNKAQRH